MTERVEECKNDWLDGTCPQCGECHYITVRRERFRNLETALARVRAALDGTHFYHKAYEPECSHCRAALEGRA